MGRAFGNASAGRSAFATIVQLQVWALFGVALGVAAPVAFVLASFFGDASAQEHIWAINGPRYLIGTLSLCLIVGVASVFVGAGAAMLTTLAKFPGRGLLAAALALPLAMPAYISAYAFADLVGPFGLWAHVAGDFLPPPDIRNLAGAAFVLTLAVYPYVYLAMRASLEGRSGALLEAARMQGAPPLTASLKVLLPAGRAALAGGLALALMETAADFGVADYFGVSTLSVGIFRTWYGLGDLLAASQLAGGLFLLALLFIVLEERSRAGLGAEGAREQRNRARIQLSPFAAIGAIAFCAMPVILGFFAPVALLAAKLGAPNATSAAHGLADATRNTAVIAMAGALIAALLASLLVYANRRARSLLTQLSLRIATMGYALPGAVIAIGVLALATATKSALSLTVGGLGLLTYAYVARFLTAGYNTIAGGVAQIHPRADDAAKMLGAGAGAIMLRIHWPLARGALAAGIFIVLIDIAKELPATLLLRPFNFETLATHIYRLASDERLADAAPAALILVGLSVVPVLWLEVASRRRSHQTEAIVRSTQSQIKST